MDQLPGKDSISRRQWLVKIPLLAAGAGFMGTEAAAAPPPQVDNKNTLGARTYNVKDFGAKGDGRALDTKAVQAAIDSCHADQGGIVLFPAGDFLCGTLELK